MARKNAKRRIRNEKEMARRRQPKENGIAEAAAGSHEQNGAVGGRIQSKEPKLDAKSATTQFLDAATAIRA